MKETPRKWLRPRPSRFDRRARDVGLRKGGNLAFVMLYRAPRSGGVTVELSSHALESAAER